MQTTGNDMKRREGVIVRTSLIGIAVNLALAGFKAAMGLLANSISIILDAVNNLSDALSSIITIIGAKLAGKPADKKHPLGYGRIENLSATIIAVIILYAGITSLIESIKSIINPEPPEYSVLTLILVGVAIAAKLLLGRYVKSMGDKVNSDSLRASGKDALSDAIISAATLIAAVVFMISGLSLEAYLAAVISLYIIKAGFEALSDTISQILGQRIEGELASGIKRRICETEGVQGAYDLVLHNYGPDKLMGSVHVSVPEDYTAARIDSLTRDIQQAIYTEFGVIITAVGIYALNADNTDAAAVRSRVYSIIGAFDYILQTHGFHVDFDKRVISVDVVIDFAAPDRVGLYNSIRAAVSAAYPDYTIIITLDSDVSDN